MILIFEQDISGYRAQCSEWVILIFLKHLVPRTNWGGCSGNQYLLLLPKFDHYSGTNLVIFAYFYWVLMKLGILDNNKNCFCIVLNIKLIEIKWHVNCKPESFINLIAQQEMWPHFLWVVPEFPNPQHFIYITCCNLNSQFYASSKIYNFLFCLVPCIKESDSIYIVKSLKIMDNRTNKLLHWFGADFTLV